MNFLQQIPKRFLFVALSLITLGSHSAQSADKELLEILLQNSVITQEQFDRLVSKETLTTADILSPSPQEVVVVREEELEVDVSLDDNIQMAIDEAVAKSVHEESFIKASYGDKGFAFSTRDGNFATNLQWRAQFRYSNPFGSDPRQIKNFNQDSTSSFEQRRLRMKIGGHGFQPWIKYYFEVDLQPARDVDADAISSGARVIDWRVDLAKWEWGGIRMGQWKVDFNRERVDSSGRQQFVERSIVNRIFTIDRQVGVQLRGRLFKGSLADLNYYAGVFNGEGRSVKNSSDEHLYVGRLQWNFLGRHHHHLFETYLLNLH